MDKKCVNCQFCFCDKDIDANITVCTYKNRILTKQQMFSDNACDAFQLKLKYFRITMTSKEASILMEYYQSHCQDSQRLDEIKDEYEKYCKYADKTVINDKFEFTYPPIIMDRYGIHVNIASKEQLVKFQPNMSIKSKSNAVYRHPTNYVVKKIDGNKITVCVGIYDWLYDDVTYETFDSEIKVEDGEEYFDACDEPGGKVYAGDGRIMW